MLNEELKELKEQLKTAEAAEGDDLPEEVPAPEEVEEKQDDIKAQPEKEPVKEPEKEAPKEEPKSEVKEELDAQGHARLRIIERENAALKRQLEEAKAKPVEVEPQEEQPGVELPPVLLEIVKEHQFNAAGVEFNQLEANFRRSVPDYDDVSNAYKVDLFHSVRIDNPRWTEDMILKETNRRLLTKASQYVAKGLDPIQEMYEDAKVLGYKAKPKEQAKPEPEVEIKPDLDKLAANKERSAGFAGANGGRGGQPQMTLQTAASIPPGEWAKMSREQKNEALKLTNAG